MAKVAIGAGHGLYTAGKRTPDDEREWSFNNKVVKSAIKQLKEDGHQVLRLDDPTGRTDVPLRERTNKANAWGADILISVHHNAYLGRWGTHTGTETFIYDNASNESLKLAKSVQAKIVGAYGLYDRGVKRANFHMLRESEMPAILTEGGYMDSTIDVIKMRDELVLEHVGHAIADGVAGYFGVEKESKKEAPKTQVKSSTTKKTSNKSKPKANLKVDGKWGNSTTKALQKALGTTQDGIISDQVHNSVTNAFYGTTIDFGNGKKGSMVIKALQRKIGSNVDGLLGPNTVGRLQQHLGTPHDKKLSRPSAVVKELQRRLNAGTF